MGISYESEKFTVNSGESKVHRITLPLNSTLKSASIRIVSTDKTVQGLYQAGLYINNNYQVTNERIFIPLDFGTVALTYDQSANTSLEEDDLDNFFPFQTIGGFYDFKVKKSGMQLVASIYHSSFYFTGGTAENRPLDVYVYYEIEQPDFLSRRMRRRRR
tara:strand:+ start:2430 stop:2909 length:480 start_codon:yes stop_codon:yes gene_type:complete